MRIDVFHTHIEVSPYTKGDFFELEKNLSKWVQINRKRGKYVPVGYIIEGNILFLPKGINIEILEKKFGVFAQYHREPSKILPMKRRYELLYPPLNALQEESINFLTGSGKFSGRYTQYTLNLDTSGGKTYCAIVSAVLLQERTLIFVNREGLTSHWEEKIHKFVDIPEYRVCQVDGEILDAMAHDYWDCADIYICTHQLLQRFAKKEGWGRVQDFFVNAGIGTKIYDEAHEFISSSFAIDCHTNVKRTFYLTATLGRSDKRENRVFNTMMAGSCKYDDKHETRVRKIHYIAVWYTGGIPYGNIIAMKKLRGFSAYSFIDAALKYDPTNGLMHAFLSVFSMALEHPGQILIVTPKKESVEWVVNIVCRIVGNSRFVASIYSDNTKTQNRQNQNADIISSTISSCGTGFDPPNLQTIICMEPHKSDIMTHQLKGRLDRFKGSDTYFYDLFDRTISEMVLMNRMHEQTLSAFIKDSEVINL